MKNKTVNHLLFWAMIISFALAMNSCGARKTAKTETSETIKTETGTASIIQKTEDTNVKVIENTTIDDKNETTTKEITYEPIDPNRPSVYTDGNGKKQEFINSKIHTKETTQKNNTKAAIAKKAEAVSKSELSEKTKSDEAKEVTTKSEVNNTDRKAWNPLNLLWLLLPVGIVLFIFNKKIWWI